MYACESFNQEQPSPLLCLRNSSSEGPTRTLPPSPLESGISHGGVAPECTLPRPTERLWNEGGPRGTQTRHLFKGTAYTTYPHRAGEKCSQQSRRCGGKTSVSITDPDDTCSQVLIVITYCCDFPGVQQNADEIPLEVSINKTVCTHLAYYYHYLPRKWLDLKHSVIMHSGMTGFTLLSYNSSTPKE